MMQGNSEKQEKSKKRGEWNIRPYLAVGTVAFIVIALSMVLFFMLFRFRGIFSGINDVLSALQAVVIGCIIAYLVNPIVKFFEKFIKQGLYKVPFIKTEKKRNRWARGLSVLATFLLIVLIISILIQVLIPRLFMSLYQFAVFLPSRMNSFVDWMEVTLDQHPMIASVIEQEAGDVTVYVQTMVQQQVPEYLKSSMTALSGGLMHMFNVLFNIFIGFIVAIYVLLGKERFIGQGKKLIYAVLPAERGNWVLKVIRKSHEIFIGFIVGRILSSLILGVMTFLMMILLHMPYAIVVSVLVGIFTLIPLFGQIVAVVGGTAIVMLDSPGKGVIFLVLMIVLTQINGNIIEPNVVGESVGLPAFWIIVAILLGEGLFGVIGVFAGVPIFAIIMYIIGEILDRLLRKKHLPEDSGDYLNMQGVDPKTGEPILASVAEPAESEGIEPTDENQS